MVENNFALSLQQAWRGVQDTEIIVTSNDVDVNNLTITVFNGSTEVTYTEISTATITFVKDDGNVVQGDLTVNADSLTYTMGTNEIAIPGTVRASVQLFGAAGERLTTAKFKFRVERDLITESAIESTSEFPILQALKIELEAIDVVEHVADKAMHRVSILDYGAIDDWNGVTGTDNTQAFKDALTAASVNGGSVLVPPSAKGYLIAGHSINIPEGVTLYGNSSGFNGVWDINKIGSTLELTYTGVEPIFLMNNGSEFKNITIVHPLQTPTNPPIAYPYVIKGVSSNCNDVVIENVFLYNCYQFLDFSIAHERLTVRNISGDALKQGILIDNNWDVDLIDKIHFWPFYSSGKTVPQSTALGIWRCNNATAITIGKADGIQGNNIFCYGYKRGITLGTVVGYPYGQLNNVSLDICAYGIEVIGVGGQGMIISNLACAMSPEAQALYEIPSSFAIVPCHETGLLQMNNIVTWGGHNRFMYVSETFGATAIVRLSDINVNNNADTELISNLGVGEVTISNLRSILDKKLVASSVGSSPVIFENPIVANELYTGSVAPIIKRLEYDQLPSVASATTITLPNSAKSFLITGTTTIENIESPYVTAGSEITLIFAESVIVANSGTYNLRLNSQFNATANDTLTLISNGTNWVEKGRSANI
jgi:hypothetical protein